MDKFITLQVQQISATQQQVGSGHSPHAVYSGSPDGSGLLSRCSSHSTVASSECVCIVQLNNDTRYQKRFCIQPPRNCCLVLRLRILT